MLLIAMLAAAAALVAAELLVRTWIRVRAEYYVMPPGLRMRLEPDREVLPQLESVVHFDVNSEGERGDEVPRSRKGLYRVLVTGGSQVEGLLLDQRSTWPGALQDILAAPDRLALLGASRVHVGCVARSGVGSEALALILSRVLPRYPRLHAIVITVGASDVLRWLEDGAPPSPPSMPTVPELFRCHPEQRFSWHPTQSALFEETRRLRRRWLRPVSVQKQAGRWMGHAREMRARATVRPTIPDPAPMLDHFERCLGEVVRLARSHADRVILVPQPWFDARPDSETRHVWNGCVGKAWNQNITECFSVDVLVRLMRLLHERAVAGARECDVQLVDLMPVTTPTLENYYDFVHFTPAGAAIVAHAVAQAILQPGRVSRTNRPFFREGPRCAAAGAGSHRSASSRR